MGDGSIYVQTSRIYLGATELSTVDTEAEIGLSRNTRENTNFSHNAYYVKKILRQAAPPAAHIT